MLVTMTTITIMIVVRRSKQKAKLIYEQRFFESEENLLMLLMPSRHPQRSPLPLPVPRRDMGPSCDSTRSTEGARHVDRNPGKSDEKHWWFDGWWIMVQYSSWSLHPHQSCKDIKDFSTSVTSVTSILNPFSLISSQLERYKGWKSLSTRLSNNFSPVAWNSLDLLDTGLRDSAWICVQIHPNPLKSFTEMAQFSLKKKAWNNFHVKHSCFSITLSNNY